MRHPPSPDGATRLVLSTADGQRLDAGLLSGVGGGHPIGVALAHGFTGSWRGRDVLRAARALAEHADVLAFDFRGHGGSTGRSTLGDREILDLDAAVGELHRRGYRRVVTVGFSMGGSVVIRHAALHHGVDAVVSVSSPSRWFVRDTFPMRRLHWVVERRLGRTVARLALGTRIGSDGWDPVPEAPLELVGKIAPTPLLIVHGDADGYFGTYHARDLAAAAGEPTELWIVPGFGHAEAGADPTLLGRIAAYLPELLALPGGRSGE